jgi:hypothetical protein
MQELHLNRRPSSDFNHTIESNLLDFNEDRFNEETAGALGNFPSSDFRSAVTLRINVERKNSNEGIIEGFL